jgi:antitoxin component HigA of HigAB toxin-antitoxin module
MNTTKKHLKRLMKQEGLKNQADLARRLGVSESFISYLFSGKRRLGVERAIELSRRLEIPMEELYR